MYLYQNDLVHVQYLPRKVYIFNTFGTLLVNLFFIFLLCFKIYSGAIICFGGQ